MLIDIHSHHLHSQPAQKQFIALEASQAEVLRKILPNFGKDVFLSVGVHPWQALHLNFENCTLLLELFSDPRVMMIGEVGLDKISPVDFNLQKNVFYAQIDLAEKVRKPVLLHVVRAMSEILECKRMHPNVPAWIVHGFRGGPREAEQYVSKGFYLSFGSRFNNEGLLACPIDMLFLETDEGEEDLSAVYERVTQVLQIPVDVLEKRVESNLRGIFKT